MLRRRSSISSTNTSKIRDRKLKSILSDLLYYGKYVAIFIVLAVGIGYFSKLLIIKNISCTTNEGNCPAEFDNLLSYVKGKNIMFLNKKQVSETVKNVFPIDSLTCSFIFPNNLKVEINGWQSFVPMKSYQVASFPALSMDIAYLSTESAAWRKPSIEINSFLQDKESKGQKLWAVGRLTPEVVEGDDIKHLFVENPTEEMLSDYYRISILGKKYLENPKIIIIGSRVLLSQEYQPDIIINVPADFVEVESALQSIEYLYTIKKDAKVIDLSFKHPIIK